MFDKYPADKQQQQRRPADNRGPDLYLPAMPPLGLISFLEGRVAAWRRRRNIQRLLKLDDHLLEDIGYQRRELRQMLYRGRGTNREK